MRIIVDIDGTICTQTLSEYDKAIPIPENIAKINELYDAGDHIIYWTSRGNTTTVDWYEMTRKQLEEWGCKFNKLAMDKPSYDLWIDDKSIRIEEL
jgi:histidinol phosphatase-like enzyme